MDALPEHLFQLPGELPVQLTSGHIKELQNAMMLTLLLDMKLHEKYINVICFIKSLFKEEIVLGIY